MLIIGAGGFAKQLFEAIPDTEYAQLTFYDDINMQNDFIWKQFPILHNLDTAKVYFQNYDQRFALGVAVPKIRALLAQKFMTIQGSLSTIVDPYARISPFVTHIGNGCTILHGAVIEGDVFMGEGCLLNLYTLVTHDSQLGDYCELGPGAQLLGGSQLGHRCFIGAGAIILPNVKIGDDVIVGAGAIVTRDVPSGVLVKGIPAKNPKY